jgi:hypothetical protein
MNKEFGIFQNIEIYKKTLNKIITKIPLFNVDKAGMTSPSYQSVGRKTDENRNIIAVDNPKEKQTINPNA